MEKINLIAKYLIENNLKLSTVESCTGGLLSSVFTDVSGSSAYTTLNLVTYSNESKHNILGVDNIILENYGAVSKECAMQMAEGLFKLTKSDICISTTGIAGPIGGTKEKPVGLMYSAIYTQQNAKIYRINATEHFERIDMKKYFVEQVLQNLVNFLSI